MKKKHKTFLFIFFVKISCVTIAIASEITIGVFKRQNDLIYTLSGSIATKEHLSLVAANFTELGVLPEASVNILMHKDISVQEIINILVFLKEINITNYIISFDHVLQVRASFLEHDPEAKIFLENKRESVSPQNTDFPPE